MSGFDYVGLDGLDNQHHYSARKVATGLGLLLVAAAGWAVNQAVGVLQFNDGSLSHSPGTTTPDPNMPVRVANAVHFRPPLGLQKVTVKPGPVSLLGILSAAEEPGILFSYGPLHQAMIQNISNGPVAIEIIEAWVYGASFQKRHSGSDRAVLASPTGMSRDILKGWTVEWSLETSLPWREIQLAINTNSTFQSQVKRSTVWVVRQDGTSEEASWYYVEKAPLSLKCPQCDKVFDSEHDLNRHRQIDSPKNTYFCAMCNKSFAKSGNLLIHMRDPGLHKPFTCRKCNKTFAQLPLLQAHMKTHSGEKPFQCEECGQNFTSFSNLNRHKKMHAGEKAYKCDICGQTFHQAGNLAIHTRKHTGERPYACLQCEKSYKTASGLKYHMLTHSGEKPYPCPLCEKNFTQGGNLKQHMIIHTGEKLFQCDLCNRSFSRNDHLQIHLRSHAKALLKND
eukprot:gb/GEZN01005556.1/.p1 GENE.gb/GEZN01005556.1/~~gb/GEZN01005556.1/.p1  ORF type:complete len:451 (+),score=25.16 gb/GEZN01005556.1/:52-1404(+)